MKTNKNPCSGFAMGVVLMVIVLVGVIATMLSITGTGTSSITDAQRVRTDASIIRTQGAQIREAFTNMIRAGNNVCDIDFKFSPSAEARYTFCALSAPAPSLSIRSQAISGLNLKVLPRGIYSNTAHPDNPQQVWEFDPNACMGSPCKRSVVAILKHPITANACLVIQSLIASTKVTSIAASPNLTYAPVNLAGGVPSGKATVTFSSVPSSVDGCLPASNATTTYYYFMVLGGRATS